MLHADWFDNNSSDIEVIASNKYKNSSYLWLTKTSCWNLSCSLFLVQRRSCTYVLSGLSMQYFFMVAITFLLGRSTIVIALWTCFNCSSRSLDRGEVTISLSVSSVETSLTARTMGLRKQRSCSKSNTPTLSADVCGSLPCHLFGKLSVGWLHTSDCLFWHGTKKFSQIGLHFCQSQHSPYKTFCRAVK